MDISPVIIVKNAERTIAKTLESLKEFEEVIVYDTGSTDNTIEIARNYKNVKLSRARFEGFSKSKNKAAKLAKNDWVLSIDADEVISPDLMNSIRELSLEPGCTYRFKRNNYYRNKIVRYSGWGREYVVRIYNRAEKCFNKKLVHEHIVCEPSMIRTIKGELRHYSYHSISNFVIKRDVYSELFAIENKGLRKSSPFLALIRGAFDFLNTYIIKLGILDGYRGVLISVSNANVTFYKYLKLYEANKCNTKKISLIVRCEEEVESLKHLINSLLFQTIPPDEIIFSLEGNFKSKIEEIKEFSKTAFIPITYVCCGEGEFLSDQLENAITKARYDFIIVVKADTFLAKNFIWKHVEKAQLGSFALSKSKIVAKARYQKLIKKQPRGRGSFISSISGKLFYQLSRIFGKPIKFSFPQYNSFSFFMEDYIGLKSTSVNNLEENLINKGLSRKEIKYSSLQFAQKPKEKSFGMLR